MTLVRAIRTCFAGAYHEEGEEFEYDGPENENLEPVKQGRAKHGDDDDEKPGKGSASSSAPKPPQHSDK